MSTKIHLVSASERVAVEFILSQGQLHDAPQGRLLMEALGRQKAAVPLVMDGAYEDNRTRYLAQALNFVPVVPPRKNRKQPWEYDKKLYKRRNEIERLFRLLVGFRRVFCRFEKLDIMFIGFVQLALFYVAIK